MRDLARFELMLWLPSENFGLDIGTHIFDHPSVPSDDGYQPNIFWNSTDYPPRILNQIQSFTIHVPPHASKLTLKMWGAGGGGGGRYTTGTGGPGGAGGYGKTELSIPGDLPVGTELLCWLGRPGVGGQNPWAHGACGTATAVMLWQPSSSYPLTLEHLVGIVGGGGGGGSCNWSAGASGYGGSGGGAAGSDGGNPDDSNATGGGGATQLAHGAFGSGDLPAGAIAVAHMFDGGSYYSQARQISGGWEWDSDYNLTSPEGYYASGGMGGKGYYQGGHGGSRTTNTPTPVRGGGGGGGSGYMRLGSNIVAQNNGVSKTPPNAAEAAGMAYGGLSNGGHGMGGRIIFIVE